MDGRSRPRRPAILDSPQAELIEGDHDPAQSSELAHDTAQAAVGLSTASQEFVGRIRATVSAEGLDAVASLWSRSPATTLPGALWRLYLLKDWIERDPQTVAARYAAGEPDGAPEPRELLRELDELFAGKRPQQLAALCGAAAEVFTVFARGTAAAVHDAQSTGTRAGTAGLQATAAELHRAAEMSRRGALQ